MFYCIEGNLYINNVYLYVTAKLDLCAISILRFPAALLASGHKTVFFVLSMAFHECLNCSQNFRRRGGWTQSMVLKRNHAFLIFYQHEQRMYILLFVHFLHQIFPHRKSENETCTICSRKEVKSNSRIVRILESFSKVIFFGSKENINKPK